MNKRRYCNFSVDKKQNIHVKVQGLDGQSVASVVGIAISEGLNAAYEEDSCEERKKEAVDICRIFCDAMNVNTIDLIKEKLS